jgi:hypothetical protein
MSGFNETEAGGNHYHKSGKDTVTELYEEGREIGHGFCYGNVKKYLKRLGKKGSTPEEIEETAKKDLYKIANYALIMLEHEYGVKYKLVKETTNDN